MNLRDRDNLQAKDKRPVPKMSFVRRLNCNEIIYTSLITQEKKYSLRLLYAVIINLGYINKLHMLRIRNRCVQRS